MHYQTRLSEVRIGPRVYQLHTIENVEVAIDQMFAELESRGAEDLLEELCPYFGTLWPAGQALAEWVWAQGAPAFAGRRVLELGCGLALPSLVAAHLGAHATASDLHPDVPAFLEKNLTANPGLHVGYTALDWRNGTVTETYDWILASDVLYERHHPESLVRFLSRSLGATGRAVVFDPRRSFWEQAKEQARHFGLSARAEELDEGGVLLAFEPEKSA
ncbi:methyltransferase domain-containing protein [bacterium]|nr:methyltransferase domain-containing protein [bacterium]